jgi:signal transduction histidine kinase/ActR/RegA family two-component response regulator
MSNAAPDAGLALACDASGRVRRILLDALGLDHAPVIGGLLSAAVDAASVTKVEAFFAAVALNGAAFDWEINAAVGGALQPLHCMGVATDGQVLVVAAPTSAEVARVYDELAGISNQLGTDLRAATQAAQLPARASDAMYDELTHLNNELVTTQRQLAKANAQLAALNEQKNQLLGMAAHDLRSPIGAIEAYSQFLLESDLPFSDEQREFVCIIRDSSLFMLHLIEDLLDVAQVEAGQLTLERALTDLVALVERCVAINRVLAARKSIRLVSRCDADLPAAWVDPDRINQVLTNLVTNALKFSHPDTEVAIRLRQQGEELILAVTDHGQGIPEAERDRLFHAFERTSVRPTGGERSTGLGLAIVQRIVAGHGGRIWVDSQVGRGSTFSVALPVADTPAAGAAEVSLPSLRILAADDNAVNRRLIGRLLEKLGHVTVLVEDGRQAVAAWQQGGFDAILLDVEMPEMDGIQAAGAIRAAESGAGRVPILAITGHTDAASHARCSAAGMDGWVSKPLHLETLGAALARAMRVRSAPAAA